MKRTTLLIACSTSLLTLAAQPAGNAAPALNPANGHYYDAVLMLTNWPGAKALAEAQCYCGLPGHLVTITTQEENDFIVAKFPQVRGTQTEEYWIGAFQPPASTEPGGNWQWITGEAFEFPNWSAGEPNNAGGNEDAAHFYAGLRDGRWNDRPATDSMAGYVIEYEAPMTAGPVFNPANGHYYDAVLTLTNWHGAKALAEAQCFLGLPGHLVTITTQEENDFIVAKFPQVRGTQTEEYWIGAFQPPASPEPGGNWQWITGEQFSFPNWSSGEPNNAGGNEDAAHFYAGLRDGRWNDRPATDSMAGYVVEYELPRSRAYPAIEVVFPTCQSTLYQLQVSTDFSTWEDFGPPIQGSGIEHSQLVPTRHGPKQFFRVIPLTCPH